MEPVVDSSDDSGRAERAVALAERLLRDAQRGISRSERRRQARLARIVADPQARELVQQLTDEVLRLERPRRAAERFARLVTEHGVPRSLGPLDRRLLAVGARLATRLPAVVMPLATRRIIAETRGLVIPAEDPALAGHVTARRAAGVDLNLNLLGEAILSDDEAAERVRRLVEVIRRPDVNYLSVKISAICALLDVYAYDHSLGRIRQALETVFDAAAAASPTVFVNLDMEEYRRPAPHRSTRSRRCSTCREFAGFHAGIVLQAYLPDSHDVFDHLAGWAQARAPTGEAAPIKIRIVKGANLAMERVDAEQHGWVQAPYATKAEVDASYKRLLGSVLVSSCRRVGAGGCRQPQPVRHRLGAGRCETSSRHPGAARWTIEMLEGMVPAQARATLAAAGVVAAVLHRSCAPRR
ncbi:MAG: proline dehydrogenase family protein [Ilumatobacteraceae bacterium]